jgi:hypothetical protein
MGDRQRVKGVVTTANDISNKFCVTAKVVPGTKFYFSRFPIQHVQGDMYVHCTGDYQLTSKFRSQYQSDIDYENLLVSHLSVILTN